MRVILDAHGGDNAPLEAIKGACLATAEYGCTVVLCGNEPQLRALAEQEHLSLDHIEFLPAEDVISMEDEPGSILKAHKDCSMAVGLRAVAAGEGDAFISAGSTGALLMGATFLVKRIKGVSRPAIGSVLPSEKFPYLLLDMGANVECRPEMLLQFAHMGYQYMTHVIKHGEPASVGLLNVGTEDTKGGDTQKAAFALLKESALPFVGNVEARQVPLGGAEVVVTDGFSGNVLLKGMEGIASMLMHELKGVFYKNTTSKLAALMVKGGLSDLKKLMDTAEYGGAPILGVKRPVIKAHGNSNANAFKNAVRVALEFAEADVIAKIEQALAAEKESDPVE